MMESGNSFALLKDAITSPAASSAAATSTVGPGEATRGVRQRRRKQKSSTGDPTSLLEQAAGTGTLLHRTSDVTDQSSDSEAALLRSSVDGVPHGHSFPGTSAPAQHDTFAAANGAAPAANEGFSQDFAEGLPRSAQRRLFAELLQDNSTTAGTDTSASAAADSLGGQPRSNSTGVLPNKSADSHPHAGTQLANGSASASSLEAASSSCTTTMAALATASSDVAEHPAAESVAAADVVADDPLLRVHSIRRTISNMEMGDAVTAASAPGSGSEVTPLPSPASTEAVQRQPPASADATKRADAVADGGRGPSGRRPQHSVSFGGADDMERPATSTSQPEGKGRLAPRVAGLPATIDETPPQTFAEYLQLEFQPGPSFPTADAVWGQTERDRVYNALVYVPYQLERLLWFGFLVALDTFLAIFTVVPARVLGAALTLIASLRRRRGAKPSPNLSRTTSPLRGDQLYDLICVGIFGCTVFFLRRLDAGAMYFWLKDLTHEFLKLHVIYTAVEIFDKIFCSFGVDTLEALSGTCALYASGTGGHRGKLRHVVADAVVALLLVGLHALVLMCQGMAFSVAMNSKRSNAIVALLIASNFGEIKGTVLKRFDPRRLFILACQDVVERFHLGLALAFVLTEEMNNSGHWLPNADLLRQAALFFGAETIIDITKHAVLGKFNEIRPGVYREFMKDLCESVKGAQPHNLHRTIAFEPLAPAALFTRIFLTFVAVQGDLGNFSWLRLTVSVVAVALGWAALMAAKLGLGFALKRIAASYTHHFEHAYGKSRQTGRAAAGAQRPAVPPSRTLTNLSALMQGAAAPAHLAGRKTE